MAGLFEFGGVTVAEVAFDGGEMAAESVVGEGAADPAGKVAAGYVVPGDVRVAVPDVAAELFECRGGSGFASGVEVEPAMGWQWRCDVFALVADMRADPVGLEYAIVEVTCSLLAAVWGCQAAIWYSCVSPPRTCFRRIRCSARLICGGRV